jgi:hypothetical protein
LAANTKNGKIYKVFQDGDAWDSNLSLYSLQILFSQL